MKNTCALIAPSFLSFYAKRQTIFENEYIKSLNCNEYGFSTKNFFYKYTFEDMRLDAYEFDVLNNFFNLINSSICSFKFKDLDDFDAYDQELEKTDRNSYILSKSYSYIGKNNEIFNYKKKIHPQNLETKSLQINTDEKLLSIEDLDLLEGQEKIDLKIDIQDKSIPKANFAFYINARFINDKIDYIQESSGNYLINNLEIIEIENE